MLQPAMIKSSPTTAAAAQFQRRRLGDSSVGGMVRVNTPALYAHTPASANAVINVSRVFSSRKIDAAAPITMAAAPTTPSLSRSNRLPAGLLQSATPNPASSASANTARMLNLVGAWNSAKVGTCA